jgi:dynein heavy chain
VPSWSYPSHEERPKFAQLVIPTLDSVRLERLVSLVYSVKGSSLLVGGPGTAKTATINQFLSGCDVPGGAALRRWMGTPVRA